MVPAVLLAALLTAAPRPSGPPPERQSEEERAFCAAERGVIERRRKVFEAQGLPGAEIARRNEPQLRALQECHERFQAEARRAAAKRQDLDETARRAGPDATELERERTWREVRRERLGALPPSSLTAEEKAELAPGSGEDLRQARSALDEAHRRDPAFMRIVRGASACYQEERRSELQEAITSEERMVAVGAGDRQAVYRLRSELRQIEAALETNREAARALPGGPERCDHPTVARIATCLRASLSETEAPAACAPEEIQQYVRLAR